MTPKQHHAADVRFMAVALAEARKALGRTHPNPAVGAVVVKKGRVIARGFHARAGAPHAEMMALEGAGARARGSTLYVTLEPCNHFGRTPPCTEAIISSRVRRVVYASEDPNPLVNGKGRRRLLKAGIEVTLGVLRAEADAINRPYLKAMTEGLAFVTLKAGITLDGKLATSSGQSKWITSPQSRSQAHVLRDRADVIVVGAQTVITDDPALTTRIPGGRSPIRLVLDPRLRTSPKARVYSATDGVRRIVAVQTASSKRVGAFVAKGVEVWKVRGRGGRFDLRALLGRLVDEGLFHVLVEGGARVHQSFLEARLADEVVLFIAPKLFGHRGLTWTGDLSVAGVEGAIALRDIEAQVAGSDLRVTARLKSSAGSPAFRMGPTFEPPDDRDGSLGSREKKKALRSQRQQ